MTNPTQKPLEEGCGGVEWARQNLRDVIQSIVHGDPPCPELLKAAEEAQKRILPPQEGDSHD